MSEAAAIIALIASIASFVDLSAKVVSRLHDFTSETLDIPDSFRALSVRLPLLTAAFQRVQTQAEAGILPEDVTKALKTLVDNASEQVSVIQTYLSKIVPLDGPSELEQALKALKSLAKEDKLQQTVKTILAQPSDKDVSQYEARRDFEISNNTKYFDWEIDQNQTIKWLQSLSASEEIWAVNVGAQNAMWDSFTTVVFSPDGQLVACGFPGKIVRFWETATGELRCAFHGHTDSVYSKMFSACDQVAVILHSGKVTSVAFSPDNQLVASGSGNKTVRLWDMTGKPQGTLKGHSDKVTSVVFSPNNQLVASGSGDKTVRLWDATTGELRITLEGHTDKVTSVAFSSNNQLVASGSDDKTVRLWDATTGELRITLEGHTDKVTSVAFSSNNQLVASGSGDKTTRLWDATTGELRITLEGYADKVTSVAFSPNNQLVASGSGDRTVRLWDATTGELRITLEGYADKVTSVAFSPNNQLVASGSGDKTVRLWDTTTIQIWIILERYMDMFKTISFPSYNQLVVSGSRDMIRLWDATTGKSLPKPSGIFWTWCLALLIARTRHLIFPLLALVLHNSPGPKLDRIVERVRFGVFLFYQPVILVLFMVISSLIIESFSIFLELLRPGTIQFWRPVRPAGYTRIQWTCVRPVRPAGYTRIQWTCRCGTPLYDDFLELQTGAAVELAKSLAGKQIYTVQGTVNPGSESYPPADDARSSPPGPKRPSDSCTSGSSKILSTLSESGENQSNDLRSTNRLDGRMSSSRADPLALYLLLCVDEGRYTTRLSQANVFNIRSDQELMQTIAMKLFNLHSRWYSWTRLRTVSNIQFVQFELHRRGLVDIRKRNDIPPTSREGEYIYNPIPAKLIPPVGSNHLLHIYNHPEDAEDEKICLNRFPKRLNAGLSAQSELDVIGWGVHLQEGLHWTKIWILGFFSVVLSTVFGIAWTIFKHDIQGGFGVAAYMIAVFVFSMGALQAYAG